MTTISAYNILSSCNEAAPHKVLSTLLLRYPRFIHAELLTHRVFSRNAASSRAIPVKKMIDDILADTAMPIHWGANQKGMQADKECDAKLILPKFIGQVAPSGIVTDDGFIYERKELMFDSQSAWLEARDNAIRVARAFDAAGYHKQVINRLLEPFLHITVLVSATEWDNFLALRDHKDAEPHIQMLAREVRKCMGQANTAMLKPGEWHLPFVEWHRNDEGKQVFPVRLEDHGVKMLTLEEARKLSVARCASTSYKTVDGFDMTLDKAQEVFDKLVTSKPLHASPLEHVAMVDDGAMVESSTWDNPYPKWEWNNPLDHGNFVGFCQFRHMLGA